MAHMALGSGYYSFVYSKPALGQQEYEKALALSSRTTEREHLQMQANYADDQGHVEEAIQMYRTYLGRYPDDWRMHLDYARILFTHDRR